ncbi:MAG: site-2 protease family protein [Anaerolineae bacterium]|nr:site-2 protease family protein [Anaerolineae bacterium]
MFNLNIASIFTRIITLVIAFTIHEFAHAWTANRFGDQTPKMNGRLTLNPVSHIDPIGALMLIIAGFGWAKPVPVNPYALRRHSRSAMMWVSLAGPLSNLLLALAGSLVFLLVWNPAQGLVLSAGSIFPTIEGFLYYFIIINLSLMVFNMLPIFPLDGEKVLDFLLPPNGQDFLASIRPYGSIILLVVVFVLPMIGIDILGAILGPVLRGWTSLLLGG